MSVKERAAPTIIGIIGLLFGAIQAWDVLERRGLMLAVVAWSIWIVFVATVSYSVYRNLRDARSARKLQDQLDGANAQHAAEISAATMRHHEEVTMLRGQIESCQADIKKMDSLAQNLINIHRTEMESLRSQLLEARKAKQRSPEPPTIHLAQWGVGPGDDAYVDVTVAAQGYVNRGVQFQASNTCFGHHFQGAPKHLKILYSRGDGSRKWITFAENAAVRFPEDIASSELER